MRSLRLRGQTGNGLNLDDGSSGTFMLDESSSIFELEASEAIDGGSDSNFEINLEDSSGMVEDGDFALDAEMIVDDGSDSLAGSGDDELVEEFFAVSVERRITHPCVLAITDAARGQLFG